jgi:FkbM family methyltransferase
VVQTRGQRRFLKFDVQDLAMADLVLGEIFYAQVYFPRFNKWDRFDIKRGDTVIDIGGNVGLFAVCAANLSRTGTVYSFEPGKENFARLIHHKELNRLSNIVPICKGVSDKKEAVKLYLVDDNCGAHTMFADKADVNVDTTKSETIECISLKDVFDEYGIQKCDFLKIDCEGAELKIISALPAEYFQRIERIALEYHANVDVLEIAELLHSHGFSITIRDYPQKWGLLFAARS